MTETRIAESRCPNCGWHVSHTTNVDGEDIAPECGQLTLCYFCGAVMIFDAGLKPRWLTQDELENVLADRKLVFKLAQLVETLRFMPKGN